MLRVDAFFALLCYYKVLENECIVYQFCILCHWKQALFINKKLSPGWLYVHKYKFMLTLLTQILGLNVRLVFFPPSQSSFYCIGKIIQFLSLFIPLT